MENNYLLNHYLQAILLYPARHVLRADAATGYSLVYLQEDLFVIMAQSSGKHDPVKLQHTLTSNETNQEARKNEQRNRGKNLT